MPWNQEEFGGLIAGLETKRDGPGKAKVTEGLCSI